MRFSRKVAEFGQEPIWGLRWWRLGLRTLANRYIKVARRWKDGQINATSEKTKEKIRRRMLKFYSANEIDGCWCDLAEKLENPALAGFVSLVGGRSKAFMDALIVAPSVRILNTALKWGVDGNPIPKSDMFYRMLPIDPTFGSLWFRYRVAVELIRGAEMVTDVACGNMLSLGLLWELFPKELPKYMVACDLTSEPEIVASCNNYVKFFGAQGMRLDFRQEDLFNTLRSLPERSQDVILATGVCSYLSEEELQVLLDLAISRLRPGGALMTDLQLKGWPMTQNILVLGWNAERLVLQDCVDSAVAMMEQMTENLGLISVNYYTNPNITNPKDLFEVLFVMRAD